MINKKWNDKIGFELEFLARRSQLHKIRKILSSRHGNCFKMKQDYSVHNFKNYDDTYYDDVLGYELITEPFPLNKGKILFQDAMNVLENYETNRTCGLHVNISCKNIKFLNPLNFIREYDFDSSSRKYKRYSNNYCVTYKRYFDWIENKVEKCNLDLKLLKISKKRLIENAFHIFMRYVTYNDRNYKKSIIFNNILESIVEKFECNGYKYHNINLRNIKYRGYLEIRFFGNKNYQFKTSQILKDIDEIISAMHSSIKLS